MTYTKQIILMFVVSILCLSIPIHSSANYFSTILILVRNAQDLDIEENKVITLLNQLDYKYQIADSEAIANGFDVSSYKVLYFRTGTEPTQYNQSAILQVIENAVKGGSSLFVEYYGSYLAQYLGWGTVGGHTYGPAVLDKFAYVKPISSHQIFDGIPLWNPPIEPDKEEQFIRGQIIRRSGSCKYLTKLEGEQQIKFWFLWTTYGWNNQGINNEYCQEWGGCRKDRSVQQAKISYAVHGSGMLIHWRGDIQHVFLSNNCSCNDPSEIGDVGTLLMKNLLKWAGSVPVDMDLPAGWAMISLPVDPADRKLNTLFPEAVVMYGYEKGTGYVRVKPDEELEVGKGYWILLDQETSYTLTGYPIESYTYPVSVDGWAMIGGCTSTAQVLSNGCDIDVIYGYVQGAGYQEVTESQPLEPCKGYWILLNNIADEATISVETVD